MTISAVPAHSPVPADLTRSTRHDKPADIAAFLEDAEVDALVTEASGLASSSQPCHGIAGGEGLPFTDERAADDAGLPRQE